LSRSNYHQYADSEFIIMFHVQESMFFLIFLPFDEFESKNGFVNNFSVVMTKNTAILPINNLSRYQVSNGLNGKY